MKMLSLRPKIHYCRAKAPLRSEKDQSMKSVLRNVAKGKIALQCGQRRLVRRRRGVQESFFCKVHSTLISTSSKCHDLLHKLASLLGRCKEIN